MNLIWFYIPIKGRVNQCGAWLRAEAFSCEYLREYEIICKTIWAFQVGSIQERR